MPIDQMMSDAMLGTFRTMANEIKSKNITGADADNMFKTLARMEELAQTHSDMNAFSGQMMQENLYGVFSDYYSRALSAQAAAAGSTESYSEENLLKITLDALRDAVKRIRAAKEEALEENKKYDPKKAANVQADYINRHQKEYKGFEEGIKMKGGIDAVKKEQGEKIDKELAERPNAYDNSVEIETLIDAEGVIKPIENLIALGEEPGMTYPRYLRLQVERGLDKAMDGDVVVRDGYAYLYDICKAVPYSPYEVEKAKKKLELFDELASKSKFGLPNIEEVGYRHRRLDLEFEPSIIHWKNITERWESLIGMLHNWSLAHISIAPMIEPWGKAPDPPKAVKHTKDTTPGVFRQCERLFKKYHGIEFMDIFKHPTFVYQVKNDLIGDSQEMIEFIIEKVYPLCQPFQFLPQEIITEREALYVEKREQNPYALRPALRMLANYDKVFGEGRFVSKFGAYKPLDTNAKPWDWSFPENEDYKIKLNF